MVEHRGRFEEEAATRRLKSECRKTPAEEATIVITKNIDLERVLQDMPMVELRPTGLQEKLAGMRAARRDLRSSQQG